jgi:hypothetical protein
MQAPYLSKVRPQAGSFGLSCQPHEREEAVRSPVFAAVAAAAVVACSTVVVSAAPPTPESSARSSKPAGSFEMAQACGWYAIFQCAKSSRVGGPGRLIWTSDYPNFRPGWWCRVMGPYGSRGEAVDAADEYGGYAKRAC